MVYINRIKELNIWSDIRFWLVLFIVLRLIGITNAPLEMGHNWRQCLTQMTVRNFYEHGLTFFYPVIDIAGEKTGIIGSEFPFFNYLIYLCCKMFGYSHWYGRLINLIVSTLGVYFFYKLIQEIRNEKIAFYAAFILTVSVWFGFSRKIMPDTFSVAIMLIGIYYGYMYLKDAKWRDLISFFILTALGMLCKIPALSILSVFGVAVFIKSIPLKRTYILYAAGACSVAIVCLWYFYWVPYLVCTYGFELYFPRSFSKGFAEIIQLWPLFLEKFYFAAFNSYIAFGCFLIGIYLVFKERKLLWEISIGCILITVVFLIFIIKTGLVFPLHSYYIVPFVPVMAFVAAFFLEQLNKTHASMLLFIIAIESIANQQNDMFIKDSEKYILKLEAIMDDNVPKEALILINGTPSPQLMYFSNRKGWTNEPEIVKKPIYIDSVANLGATHLLWAKNKGNLPQNATNIIYQDEDIALIELERTNSIK